MGLRDNLDGVAVFVEAAEAGGFARAADRLALTRSAVGKTIARLEGRLNVRLFHRTTRSQTLTDDGLAYLEHCRRALDELRTGQALLESGRREVGGRLKVAMPVLFGRYCVAPLLIELAQRHPQLELDLRFSDSLVDIQAERFDLAIRNGAPGQASGLLTRKLAGQRKVVCAAPAYIAARGVPTDLAALAEHEALAYWRNDQLFAWTFVGEDGRPVAPPLKGRFHFDNQEAIVDAAVKGLGLAWVPDWLVAAHIEQGRLVEILASQPSTSLQTYAVWPGNGAMPLRVRAAIDWLAERLPAAIPSLNSATKVE